MPHIQQDIWTKGHNCTVVLVADRLNSRASIYASTYFLYHKVRYTSCRVTLIVKQETNSTNSMKFGTDISL